MLEVCPNCNKPVILFVKDCDNHRSSLEPDVLKPKRAKKGNVSKKAARTAPGLTLDELMLIFSWVYRFNTEDIRDGKNTLHSVVVARRHFIYSAVLEANHAQKDVASYLEVSMMSIHRGIVVTRGNILTNDRIKAKDQTVQAKIAEALASKDPGA